MLGRLSEIAQLLDPQAAMRNGSLAQALSAGIDQTNLMALARPVDAYKPFNLFRHAQALLSHHTSGPPQRASIPVLALEAQPPTGLPSRPTCRGAGPLQVLKTRGFAGDSRQASPVRPVYDADQPITPLKGTGIRTIGPSCDAFGVRGVKGTG